MDESEDQREDAELVDLARNGDTQAFDVLIIRYTPRLYSLIYNMISNREDTADLLQDVFAKAYRSLRRFRGTSSFYTWIYSIAANKTLNLLKWKKRRRMISLNDMDSGIFHDADYQKLVANTSTDRDVMLKDLQKKLNEVMLELSENHRIVVTLYDIQDIPHTEISRMLGVSEGTVRSRLHYAHRALRKLLQDYQP